MRKQRFFAGLFAAVLALLMLPGCTRYQSQYKAVGFVHSNTSKNASMEYSSFEGTMVFQLKCGSGEETIHYSAKLEAGSVRVSYDCGGTKTELFGIGSGEEVSQSGGVLQKGTVYLIVETSGASRGGQFAFEVK